MIFIIILVAMLYLFIMLNPVLFIVMLVIMSIAVLDAIASDRD